MCNPIYKNNVDKSVLCYLKIHFVGKRRQQRYRSR